MSFPNLSSVALTGGSANFSFAGSEPSSIRAGSLLIVQGYSPVEISSISEDGSKAGVLDIAWPYSNVTAGTALVVPLEGALFEKVKELVTLIQSSNTSHTALLTSIATLATSTGNVEIEDATDTTHTLQGWLSLESIALNKMREYGVSGTSLTLVTDPNTITENGNYACHSTAENLPEPLAFTIRHDQHSAGHATQTFIALGSSLAINTNKKFVRHMDAGVWENFSEDWTEDNFQPETSGGLGVVRLMRKGNAGSITDGSTIAGSSLQFALANSSGVVVADTSVPAGTWKNISGITINFDEFSWFVRIA